MNEKGNVLKDYMGRIMNDKNNWDLNIEGVSVEGSISCVSQDKVVQALNEITTGKTFGP